MKKVVERSKQTVWVLTMLTVMVVLSAYYLVSGPIIPVEMAGEEAMDMENQVTADITIENTNDLTDMIGTNSNDYFIGLKLDRTNYRSKQIDDWYTMINQQDISAEAIARIQDKIEELQATEEAEFVLESLLIANGYQDAVVMTTDTGVDVIIQSSAEALSKNEVVKIIKMVSEKLNVPAVNVHVKPIS